MPPLASTVYLVCKGSSGKQRLRGVVVAEEAGDLVVGIDAELAREVSEAVIFEKAGASSVGFVKVPGCAISEVLPAGWGAEVGGTVPSLSAALPAWGSLSNSVELHSSDVEPLAKPVVAPKATPPASSKFLSGSQRAMEAELLQMGEQLWGREESEDESESEVCEEPSRSPVKHLPPGSSGLGKVKKKPKSKSGEGDLLQKAMLQAMAAGQSPSDLMPMMMMSMMLSQQKAQEKRSKPRSSELLGSSSSDSSDGEGSREGLKAVTSMHRLDRRIKRHPRAIVREFEKELVRDLGVVPGQAWSVRDYLKKQNWGKFKGIYRTAMQDAAVYEYLRAGNSDAACAQVVQNMKSKLQCVLQGGDWTTAWMLTGLPDPLSRKEWAGSQTEMAVISGYMNSLHKLKKKIKEAKDAGSTPNEEHD